MNPPTTDQFRAPTQWSEFGSNLVDHNTPRLPPKRLQPVSGKRQSHHWPTWRALLMKWSFPGTQTSHISGSFFFTVSVERIVTTAHTSWRSAALWSWGSSPWSCQELMGGPYPTCMPASAGRSSITHPSDGFTKHCHIQLVANAPAIHKRKVA